MSDTCDEIDRVSLAVSGDSDALQALLLEHYGPLSTHIARQIPANVQASVSVEDVLQQTYIKAFQAIQGLEPRGEAAFYGWLRVIAERALMDACRKRGREQLSNKPAHSPGGRPTGSASDSMRGLLSIAIGDGPGPDQEAMREELLGAMQVVLASMPENYRQVLTLRYLEGRSQEEVAKMLGATEGAIRGLCHRARTLLKEELLRLSRFV